MSDVMASTTVADELATPAQPLPGFTMLGTAGGACDGDSCDISPFGGNDAVST